MIVNTKPPMIGDTEIQQLRSQVRGAVIVPADIDYDSARRAFNLMVDQHPPLIVMASSAADVVEALRFARQHGLPVAILATGHGVSRLANGCLLINTSQLNDVHIDAERQTAWVEAGTRWGKVLEAAQAVGLAPLLGSSPGVGAVGYTLGGGMGWLARKYGLSADSVNYFEVVTASGHLVKASESENPDLFWALRGGGGSFGVVTGMNIKLYPVTTVYGGNLFYPVEDAKAVFSRYREWIADAPDELTSSIVIMNLPPIPEIPDPLRGQSFVIVRGCYAGAVEDGDSLLAFWREWKAPIIDDFKAMPFSDAGLISNEPLDPAPGMSSGAWLRNIDDETLDILIKYGASVNGSSPITVTEVRHAGGAIARVDPGAIAYGNREALYHMQVVAITPTPEIFHHAEQYIQAFKQELAPYLTGGVYINFLEGDEKRNRTQDAFTPENFQRLATLKARYDGENRFDHSFDIQPAAGPSDQD